MGALVDGRLMALTSAAGSPKIDGASSLDIFGLMDSYKFTEKMKVSMWLLESVAALMMLDVL